MLLTFQVSYEILKKPKAFGHCEVWAVFHSEGLAAPL